MSALPEWIATLVAPWSDLYASSPGLEAIVVFLHVGGMLAAGGLAITMDRAVLRSARGGWPTRQELTREIHHAHGAVLAGLGVVLLSGLALTLSDPTTFLESGIYWAKMATVALLLGNGWHLKRAGERVLAAPDDEAAFRRLHASAIRSIGLWMLSVLGGVAITTYV